LIELDDHGDEIEYCSNDGEGEVRIVKPDAVWVWISHFGLSLPGLFLLEIGVTERKRLELLGSIGILEHFVLYDSARRTTCYIFSIFRLPDSEVLPHLLCSQFESGTAS